MKTFCFTRIVSVEERYSVTMSDDMANEAIAQSILMKQLNKEAPSDAIKLLDSRVVKQGRFSPCK